MEWLIPATGFLALVFGLIKTGWINKQSQGNETMVEIGAAVREGAMAFLRREYRVLAVFVVIVALLLYLGNRSQGTGLVAVSFLAGATASGLAGFSLGASSIALFARVGGGIYTKAADVGGDLAGKVEAGIPEDDPSAARDRSSVRQPHRSLEGPTAAQRGGGPAETVMTAEQVRAFRVTRQHLDRHTPPCPLVRVVHDLLGVQAQIPSAALLALWARVDGITPRAIEDAIHRRKSLARMWCLRGTTHIITRRDRTLLAEALGIEVGGLLRVMGRRGLSETRFRRMADAVLQALESGPLTRMQVREALAKRFPGSGPFFGSRGGILRLLSQEGRIVFGPPRGGESTFVRADRWWPTDRPSPRRVEPISELLRRYLRSYGPATLSDFAYWSGLPIRRAREARRAIESELAGVVVASRRLLLLRKDLADLRRSRPSGSVRLLPHFDAYLLGHRDKSLLLEPGVYKEVFRKAGWVSPVILYDGWVVGTWSHRMTGRSLRISLKLRAPLPRRAIGILEREAESLGAFLGAQQIALTGLS